MNAPTSTDFGIQSTAGAVPVRNDKGEIYMKKVKVQRYVSGKRPQYANKHDSSDGDSDLEDFIDNRRKANEKDENPDNEDVRKEVEDEEIDDPRLRRLKQLQIDRDGERERVERHRAIHEPQFLDSESEKSEDEEPKRKEVDSATTRKITLASDSDSDDGELSDTEIENRRQRLRNQMLQQQKQEEILQKEEENKSESSDSESSEYEDESESEEDHEPRLKPLFVRKRDRATIAEKEREAAKQKQIELEEKRAAKERRRETLRLVEQSVKRDLEKTKPDNLEPNINDVCTDDENEDVEYEAWKLRELKRIKRDREEKDNTEREKLEIDRFRNMTEEERKQELRANPKLLTNKATKGKYKFLQKYFHRGAFYMDEEQDLLKRDFAQATLEDHFDKTILPKVMQVKNFGRCGRTKYTHLVDQDTTQFDSPWYSETANNVKFLNERGAGMKQVFEKPTGFKRKKMS
ncbi:MFAP1 family protein [Megaselia abdita]